MVENSITAQRKSLYVELCSTLSSVLTSVQSFGNSFDKADFFTFSNAEQKRDEYKLSFKKLCKILSNKMVDADTYMAKMYELIILADRDLLFDEVLFIQALSEKYTALSNCIAEFYKVGEKTLRSDIPSVSTFTGYTKKIIHLTSEILNV